MSGADLSPSGTERRSRIVTAEVGSAGLEGAEPDPEIVALAEAFAAGQLREADFDTAVRDHQLAVVAVSQRQSFIGVTALSAYSAIWMISFGLWKGRELLSFYRSSGRGSRRSYSRTSSTPLNESSPWPS